MLGSRTILAALIITASTLIGCSSGDDTSGLPRDWHRFSQGAFSGAIRQDWEAAYVDATSLADLPVETAPAVAEAVQAFLESGQSNVFFVYLQSEANVTSNIYILDCEDPATVEIISDGTRLAEYYQSTGVSASVFGRVRYDDREFDLLQLKLAPEYDSYQVYLEESGCYLPATLTTGLGASQWLPDFQVFLSHLQIDVTQLRPD
jgi:hypothetical protein